MTRILGIDPGMSGALSLIDTTLWTLAIADMPLEAGVGKKNKVSAKGLIDLVRAADADHAFSEDVAASPQMGVTSAYAFGDGFGCVRASILSYGTSLWLIRPQEWKSKTRTPKNKRQATTRAAQVFPDAHKVFFGPRGGCFDGRAESALLALYGVLKLNLTPDRAIRLIDFPQE